jgi:hypothetical protein
VSLRQIVAVAGIATLAIGCAGDSEPFAMDPQHTIDVPGNTVGTSGCVTIDNTNCFAILDNQLKILYERNNWAARRGEAEYRIVTNSNNELAAVFQEETMSVSNALAKLDRFISQIVSARDAGRYGDCWGGYIQGYAEWIRGRIVAGNLDVSDAPQMSCFVSPVASVTGTGTETGGVVLTIDDPWHYVGDPYGIHMTNTYFVVAGPNGTITTTPSAQSGPATVTIADAATRTAGVHEYSVTQCADWGHCSTPVRATVTIIANTNGGGENPDPACAHDNRNKTFTPQLGEPKCEKTIKIDHPNS